MISGSDRRTHSVHGLPTGLVDLRALWPGRRMFPCSYLRTHPRPWPASRSSRQVLQDHREAFDSLDRAAGRCLQAADTDRTSSRKSAQDGNQRKARQPPVHGVTLPGGQTASVSTVVSERLLEIVLKAFRGDQMASGRARRPAVLSSLARDRLAHGRTFHETGVKSTCRCRPWASRSAFRLLAQSGVDSIEFHRSLGDRCLMPRIGPGGVTFAEGGVADRSGWRSREQVLRDRAGYADLASGVTALPRNRPVG